MLIVTRMGPWLSAFPLAAPDLDECRMCRENEEISRMAISNVHNGNSLEALKIADEWGKQIEGHSCKKWKNLGFMAPRRGRWLSVRAEKGFYDPILKEDYRQPIGRADILALGDPYEIPTGFEVVSTPNRPLGGDWDLHEGRVCQYILNSLDRDERRRLVADLKEV